MLSKEKLLDLFHQLDEQLRARGEIGEVGVVGGSAMCLVFDARRSTKDVDAVFKPTSVIRAIAARIAEAEDLPRDWLNDAAKGFIEGTFDRVMILSLANLRVWAPEAKYLLAMKCLSARWDASDKDDVLFLIQHLKLTQVQSVFKIIEGYFPKNRIPPKTQYFLEEAMEKKDRRKK